MPLPDAAGVTVDYEGDSICVVLPRPVATAWAEDAHHFAEHRRWIGDQMQHPDRICVVHGARHEWQCEGVRAGHRELATPGPLQHLNRDIDSDHTAPAGLQRRAYESSADTNLKREA